jgi:hypothetical protein
MELLINMFNLFKKPVNKELDRLEREAKKRKPKKDQDSMAINHREERLRKNGLAEIESLRTEVLSDIAAQADRKIECEAIISKQLFQIKYNQDKVDAKQKKLKDLEDKWGLFHKRLLNL